MSDFLEELLKMAESAVKELICLDNFNNPKVLPSCHSFCLYCLEGDHERTKNKNGLTCAECKARHQVETIHTAYKTCFLNSY